ncbi:MAG: hypothetical protein HYY04_10925, partial [Chloroflexi bacterium]|nr:hypothetical protein [Chloroflexota bacterium]
FFSDRMNTVFKLYYQTWVLFAVAAAYAVVALADRIGRLHQAHQDERADTGFVPTVGLVGADAWGVAAVAIALMALVYTPMALLARTEGFARTPTLDGLAYQSRFRPDDAEAIRWLQANVAGSPVILEAPGGSYSQFGRVSANTGLPTVLGWDFHERQWRGTAVDEEMNRRKADVDAMYRSTDVGQVRRLLQKYRVAYVYVGALEREQYGRQDPALLNRLRSFLDVAYDRNGVTILRVVN